MRFKYPEKRDLSFARSYQEATGRRIRASDFEPPTPTISGRFALFWTLAVVALCLIVYLWR